MRRGVNFRHADAMPYIRFGIKGMLFGLWLMLGLVLGLLLPMTLGQYWYTRKVGSAIIQYWLRICASILGMRIHCLGLKQRLPALLVSNHVSWLDVLAIAAVYPASFVAKSDTRTWPFLGYLMRSSGTIFISRERKKTLLSVSAQIHESLSRRRAVAFFPEATSGDGTRVLPFKTALFENVIRHQVCLQAIAIRYPVLKDGSSSPAPYYGSDNFVLHLLNLLKSPSFEVVLNFLPPQQVDVSLQRKTIADWTRQEISKAIELSA